MTKLQRLAALALGSIAIDIALSCAGASMAPNAAADPTVTPMTAAGSRLHIAYQQTTSDDGATSKVPIGWYDTTLAVQCSFGTYGDGSTRCMPTGADAPPVLSPGRFVDSGCTLPLAEVSTSACTVPKFISLLQTGMTVCSASTVLWHASQITPPATFYVSNGTACVQSPTPWDTTATYVFAATALVQPSELQSGKVETLAE